MRSFGRVSGLLLVAALAAAPAAALASVLTVPDDAATIQSGLDAGTDTVYVRAGEYDEAPIVHRKVSILALSQTNDRAVVNGFGLNDLEEAMTFYRLAVKDPVVLGTSRPYAQTTRASLIGVDNCIDFVECDLRGGMIDSTKYVDLQCMTFQKCSIGGDIGGPPRSGGLGLRSYCLMESCTVNGTVQSDVQDHYMEVRGCAFTGNGHGLALGIGGGGPILVDGNSIKGYESGIGASSGDSRVVVTNNVVEDCTYSAISAERLDTVVRGNVVRRCGSGIIASGSSGPLEVSDNFVEDCGHYGIFVGLYGGNAFVIVGNAVHDCDGAGIWLSGEPVNDLTFERNTMVHNTGSGLLWEVQGVLSSAVVRQNIGYANGLNGVNWTLDNATSVTCNDWFGNLGGDVAGATPSPTDFSVNPLFCDEANDNFTLLATSPLVNQPGCGQIGAFGVGCGATATLVARFTAERQADGIRLMWALGPGATASETWLERSEHGLAGPWAKPATETSQLGEVRVELDRDVQPGQTYWYRLMANEAGSAVQLGSSIEVGAVALTFALGKVGPSPTSGPVTISFSLAHGAAIDVGVFDLLGRRAATPARGEWSAGTHLVQWTEHAPAGIYLVRYRFPSGEDRRRLIRLP